MKIFIDINPVVAHVYDGDYYDSEVSIHFKDLHTNRVIDKKVFMRPIAHMKSITAMYALEKQIEEACNPVITQVLNEFCAKYPQAKE